jgi:hypothetical protein
MARTRSQVAGRTLRSFVWGTKRADLIQRSSVKSENATAPRCKTFLSEKTYEGE